LVSRRNPNPILTKKSRMRKRKTLRIEPIALKPSIPSSHTTGYSDHRTMAKSAMVRKVHLDGPAAARRLHGQAACRSGRRRTITAAVLAIN